MLNIKNQQNLAKWLCIPSSNYMEKEIIDVGNVILEPDLKNWTINKVMPIDIYWDLYKTKNRTTSYNNEVARGFCAWFLDRSTKWPNFPGLADIKKIQFRFVFLTSKWLHVTLITCMLQNWNIYKKRHKQGSDLG